MAQALFLRFVFYHQPVMGKLILVTFDYDVVIIGAGAAGLMCAIEAGKRRRRVLVLDHAKKLAEKIRISGGGRCNFTNINADDDKFLSQNPHFCKSALRQYSQHDFINLLHAHHIGFHEKNLGNCFVTIHRKTSSLCYKQNVPAPAPPSV